LFDGREAKPRLNNRAHVPTWLGTRLRKSLNDRGGGEVVIGPLPRRPNPPAGPRERGWGFDPKKGQRRSAALKQVVWLSVGQGPVCMKHLRTPPFLKSQIFNRRGKAITGRISAGRTGARFNLKIPATPLPWLRWGNGRQFPIIYEKRRPWPWDEIREARFGPINDKPFFPPHGGPKSD